MYVSETKKYVLAYPKFEIAKRPALQICGLYNRSFLLFLVQALNFELETN
jgi:hypothetical protein